MKVMIATGGTGGHLFPAIALGCAFRDRGHSVMMVGSGRELDLQVATQTEFPWQQLPVGRLKGYGWSQKLSGLLLLPVALFRALILIVRTKPELIVGIGGASSGPLTLLGRLLGLKTAILEQNRIPGLANRWLAPFAHRIFLSFPLASQHWRRSKKIRLTGTPVRPELLTQFATAEKKEERFTLLVVGGSQGAHFLNDLIVQLLPRFAAAHESFRLIHITGAAEYEQVQKAYRHYPELIATPLPFAEQIGRYYKEADFIVARAGAATLSDLMAVGRPALLIPYPHAADRHQTANARFLSEAGAALMKEQQELTPESFWQLLEDQRRDRSRLQSMERKVQSLAPPQPAERIVNECEQLFGT